MMDWMCDVKKREVPSNRFSFNPGLNKQVENEAINWNEEDQNTFDQASR